VRVTTEGVGIERAMELRWHLLLTKPSCERIAVANLERQNYGVYFPQVRKRVQRRGKWCDRLDPLFPRYLFVTIDATHQSLSPVRSTVGVVTVVRFGVEYITVPNHIIDTLRRSADPLTGIHELRSPEGIKRGEPVRIEAGVLSGLEGVFESDDGNHRVTVLLNLLGRETRIQVDAGCVIRSAA
jgi:transcriptional antiterminator RfaH